MPAKTGGKDKPGPGPVPYAVMQKGVVATNRGKTCPLNSSAGFPANFDVYANRVSSA